MLPVIQSLWIGNELSILEKLVISSFLANGHQFHLYVYQEIRDIPKTVSIRDANTIIPEKEIFVSNGSYALFADWFRWKLLERNGNFWVDMDVVCLKTFDFDEEMIFGMEGNGIPNIAVLKFPPSHELVRFMLRRCERLYEVGPDVSLKAKVKRTLKKITGRNHKNHLAWGEAGGPIGFKLALTEYGLLEHGKPPAFFYPVSYSDWQCIFDGTFPDAAAFSRSYGLHFWNELVRRAGLNKNGTFPSNSFIEQLKSRYL